MFVSQHCIQYPEACYEQNQTRIIDIPYQQILMMGIGHNSQGFPHQMIAQPLSINSMDPYNTKIRPANLNNTRFEEKASSTTTIILEEKVAEMIGETTTTTAVHGETLPTTKMVHGEILPTALIQIPVLVTTINHGGILI